METFTKQNSKGKLFKRNHDVQHDNHVDDDDQESELTDTVFIRNIARFDTTQESLKEYIEKNFGETVYCLICKDKENGESKGTAFVKFKSVETARKCLEEYEDPEHQTKFFLDGRNLFVLPALSRDKIDEVARATAPIAETAVGVGKKKKKPRHNRAKPPTSQAFKPAGKLEESLPTHKKQSQFVNGSNKNKKDSFTTNDNNKRGKKPFKKAAKHIEDKSPAAKKVKKDLKLKKKKVLAQKGAPKSRGRH